MTTLLQIAENILLLSFMGFGYFLVETNRAQLGNLGAKLLLGLIFGLTAALVTAVPLTLADGATIDARAGPVLIAGIAAGPVGAILAGLLGATSRGIVGGSFALAGIAVYGVYAIAGLALARLRLVTVDTLLKIRSIAIITFTSLLCASAMFFLITPMERALDWVRHDLPLIFIANAMSVLFSVFVVSFALIYLKRTAELNRINETLNLAKRAGGFGIWDYDVRTGTLYWDERSKELHGSDNSSFRGSYEDWSRHVHPGDLPMAQQAFADALSGEQAFDIEYRVVQPDGSLRWIKGDAIVLREPDGEAVRVVGSNFDLTPIRMAEAGLVEAQSVAVQAQKLETVGQLTGGIAHDFNNLLAVIMGNLELLLNAARRNEAFGDNMEKYIDDSVEAARRGSELTKNMLAYARKAQLKPVPLDLNQIVRQTQQWVGRMIESSVHLDAALQSDLWLTMADQGSMQSAIVNLIVNARDAVQGSGTISIRTENVEIGEEECDQAGDETPPGRYVLLSVTDNGVGMNSLVVERIFDPFYSTKPVGEGTGLGLSTVLGFVKQSKGFVRVESAPSRGTTFRLYFPAIDAPETLIEEAPAGNEVSAIPGHARILLVEDQPEVRSVVKKTLEAAGYQVQAAADGDEAYGMCQVNGPFDLVLSDIVMPGNLQGPSLASAVRQFHPHLPFIFMSGYSDYGQENDGTGTIDEVILTKPVSRQELLNQIQRSLSGVASD